MKTGALDSAIKALKYERRWGWGIIFARVVLGHLAKDRSISNADMIIPMPTYRPAHESRQWRDHIRWVIQCAIEQDEHGYDFWLDPPVVVKTRKTARMASTTSAAERRLVSEQVYESLVVPNPAVVAGKAVVVFDDVFTGGNTLNAVARRLREAGAAGVAGLTLARTPWR